MLGFIETYAHMLNRLLVKRYWASKLPPAADLKKETDCSVEILVFYRVFQACQSRMLCSLWYLEPCQPFLITSHWHSLLPAPVSLVLDLPSTGNSDQGVL